MPCLLVSLGRFLVVRRRQRLVSMGSQRRRTREGTKDDLAAVRHVEEAVLGAVLVVDGAHEDSGHREGAVDGDEVDDGLLGRKVDALADDVHGLP